MDTPPTTPNTTPVTPEKGQPEKYIRTFAGDMETVQKGGIPDLVPLAEPSARERLVTASPIQSPSEIKGPLPEPPPAAELPKESPPSALSLEPLGPLSLKTYAGDFSDRMKKTQASPVTVLAAEQDSPPRVARVVSQTSSHTGLPYIIAGVVFLVAGGIGAYVAYTYYLTASAPIVLIPSVSAPIFVDDREEVSGSGTVLMQAIATSVSRPVAFGGVRLLYLASTTSTVSVFSALHTSAPDVLVRNVQVEGSMAGVVNVGGTQSPFFILSVVSYSNTFAGMLSWEKLMPGALITLFPPYPVTVSDTTTSTTTTPKIGAKVATTTPMPTPAAAFSDATIANHDVRVYRDAAGRDVLLYGYWNQTTLIIARDSAAFTEIVQRLGTSRTP